MTTNTYELPNPARTEERNLRRALYLTSGILFAEVIGGLFSGSLALMADAGHMFVDVLAMTLSLLAIHVSKRPVGGQFTYGFRRIEVLVALLNGVILLVICALICYEAIQRLTTPAVIDIPMMLTVAAIGLAANGASAFFLRHARSINVRSAFLHVVGDLLSSVAIVIGAVCMILWNVPWLDPVLSILIAAVVLFSAYRLVSEAFRILMEAVPDSIDIESIRQSLLDLPFVKDVHDLHVWIITSGMPSLSCHVVLNESSVIPQDSTLREISNVLMEKFGISHTTVQIESTAFQKSDNECSPC